MKLTRVIFKTSTNVPGVKMSCKQICPGDPCSGEWGGGTVTSLEFDRASASLVVRKAGKFERINPEQRKGLPTFDAVMVPWADVESACACDDVDAVEVGPVPGLSLPVAKGGQPKVK
jgi:hypothetical protein